MVGAAVSDGSGADAADALLVQVRALLLEKRNGVRLFTPQVNALMVKLADMVEI